MALASTSTPSSVSASAAVSAVSFSLAVASAPTQPLATTCASATAFSLAPASNLAARTSPTICRRDVLVRLPKGIVIPRFTSMGVRPALNSTPSLSNSHPSVVQWWWRETQGRTFFWPILIPASFVDTPARLESRLRESVDRFCSGCNTCHRKKDVLVCSNCRYVEHDLVPGDLGLIDAKALGQTRLKLLQRNVGQDLWLTIRQFVQADKYANQMRQCPASCCCALVMGINLAKPRGMFAVEFRLALTVAPRNPHATC